MQALQWFATTLAADTPLAVTGLVVKDGIAGELVMVEHGLERNVSNILFSDSGARSEVITDVELTELRYSGRSASLLRGFRALYIGLPINCITMGWVILAMQKIIVLTFGLPDTGTSKVFVVLACMLIAGIYCALSGFWGVVITDLVQFGMAMVGSIALAVIAVVKIGGIGALKTKLSAIHGADHSILKHLSGFPVRENGRY